MSDEPFFPQFGWLNSVPPSQRVRRVGRSAGRDRRVRHVHGADVSINGVDTPGLRAASLGNPFLKPERTTEFEGGFDTRVLGNRVNLELTYYSKKTNDALLDRIIAPSAAASATTVRRNLASVKNAGIEATLTSTRARPQNFGWDFTIAASHNTNKVAAARHRSDSGNAIYVNGTGANRDSVGIPGARLVLSHVHVRRLELATASSCRAKSSSIRPSATSATRSRATSSRSSNGFDLSQPHAAHQRAVRLQGRILDQQRHVFVPVRQQPRVPRACRIRTRRSRIRRRRSRSRRRIPTNTSFGYLENGQFWRFRELSATFERSGVAGTPTSGSSAHRSASARATSRCGPSTKAPIPKRISSRATSRATFASSAPRRVLHAPPEPPLLTHEDEDMMMHDTSRPVGSGGGNCRGHGRVQRRATFARNCSRRSNRAPFSPATFHRAGAAGAEALRVGALGRFQQLTPGGGNGNQTEATLLAICWPMSGSRATRSRSTTRPISASISTNNTVLSTAYSDLNRVAWLLSRRDRGHSRRRTGQIERDRRAVLRVGLFGDVVGGVVLQRHSLELTVDGFFTYTMPLTNNEVYAIALTHLDSAIAAAVPVAGNLRADTLLATSIKNAASIAKGRVLVDLGTIQRCGGGRVRRADELHVQRHVLAGDERQQRLGFGWPGVHACAVRRWRQLRHAGHHRRTHFRFPRRRIRAFPTVGSPTANGTKSIDGITPLVSQQIWVNRSDPIPVATGIDARLIEAEAKLNANDIAGMMTILNALRTAPQTLGPLSIHGVGRAARLGAGDQGCRDECLLSRKGILAIWAWHAPRRSPSADSAIRPHGGSGLSVGQVPQSGRCVVWDRRESPRDG